MKTPRYDSAELRKKAASFPQSPGVYIFSDKDGTVIYVGKAKNLRNRTGQYFHSNRISPKTELMMKSAHSLDYIITSDEFEALILECSLIKRHKPKFNILLKDDKGFPFIRLDTKTPYSRLEIVSKKDSDDGKEIRYFGPYGGRLVAGEVKDSIEAALRLPICSRVFPRDIGKERPCIHYHTQRCYGPCLPEADPTLYESLMDQAILFLEGKFERLSLEIKQQMEEAAENLEFERAAGLRDRLTAISRLAEKQKIITHGKGDTDAIGIHITHNKLALAIISMHDGTVISGDINIIKSSSKEDFDETISSFIKQYYPRDDYIPDKILLSSKFGDMDLIGRYLSQIANKKVHILSPKRGVNLAILRMAEENARHEIERTTSPKERANFASKELARLIDMPSLSTIEAFDISNTGAADIVAAMVVFQDGKPEKSSYRKYAVKNIDGQDDYGAMRDVLTRRYSKADNMQLPDLVLVDGGYGHVRTALDVFKKLEIDVPVLGMVKNEKHETRALITHDGLEVSLLSSPQAYALVARIQSEAHRFALTYHRKKRRKSSMQSELDKIPGIGPVRRTALVKVFKSVQAISQASIEDLMAVIPKNTAASVYAHFHNKDDNPTSEKE